MTPEEYAEAVQTLAYTQLFIKKLLEKGVHTNTAVTLTKDEY